MMHTITAVIIAKDEEEMIGGCLSSLKFCDEILLIDGRSTDKTREIAHSHGAKIIQYPSGDFSKSRNQALLHATGDWLLYVDADERVTKELVVSIKSKLSLPHPHKAYRIKRKNFYFKKYEWPAIERLERLFQRESIKEWYGELHETAVIEGDVGDADGFLLHFSHRDLSSMLDKTLLWSTVEAKNRFSAHHPQMTWWRFPRVMLTAFFRSFIGERGWQVGTAGLIESIYQSYSAFVTYAKLWEMQHELKTQNAKLKVTRN
ncbi:MAG: glycosyltransferase family 2 protein [bacterium]|nr:glycosyltransferase family 2 protein [bacterium]